MDSTSGQQLNTVRESAVDSSSNRPGKNGSRSAVNWMAKALELQKFVAQRNAEQKRRQHA